MAHPIPDGQRSITPHLVVKGACEAIDFYKQAFGGGGALPDAFPGPDGQVKLGHAELQIGRLAAVPGRRVPRARLDGSEWQFARGQSTCM